MKNNIIEAIKKNFKLEEDVLMLVNFFYGSRNPDMEFMRISDDNTGTGNMKPVHWEVQNSQILNIMFPNCEFNNSLIKFSLLKYHWGSLSLLKRMENSIDLQIRFHLEDINLYGYPDLYSLSGTYFGNQDTETNLNYESYKMENYRPRFNLVMPTENYRNSKWSHNANAVKTSTLNKLKTYHEKLFTEESFLQFIFNHLKIKG